jgi:phosphoribosylformylglycinamidine synthase I
MNPRVAVIQFPGVNCEFETATALARAAIDPEIVRWNVSPGALERFDGFVLPGGFSYQDRVRAGAVAAADEVIRVVVEQATRGKPVVGICNGAQVLVEAGLVPGLDGGSIDLGLAPNKGMGRDGYYADWVFVRIGPDPGRCAATCCLEPGEVVPIPVAHSEGRFVSAEGGVFDRLEREGRLVFKYCEPDGSPALKFPSDPNGSERCAAGIANLRGNVVAMMPHPERGAWLRQVPDQLDSPWARRKREGRASWKTLEGEGPCARVFHSLREYVKRCL